MGDGSTRKCRSVLARDSGDERLHPTLIASKLAPAFSIHWGDLLTILRLALLVERHVLRREFLQVGDAVRVRRMR
jgi:hypothetical protein